jgi:hypothetical protein
MTGSFDRSDRPLAMSRTVLRLLVKLNIIFAIGIFILLLATLIAPTFLMEALGLLPTRDGGRLMLAMRGIMVIGILAAPVIHVIYTRLLAIVETVNAGDPFVLENAERLQTIAWSIVTLQLMHVAVVVLANGVWMGDQQIDIGDKFAITPWLTILLLFVLARVFDHGARMRDELAATV